MIRQLQSVGDCTQRQYNRCSVCHKEVVALRLTDRNSTDTLLMHAKCIIIYTFFRASEGSVKSRLVVAVAEIIAGPAAPAP